MDGSKNLKDLYLGTNLNSLEQLVNKDDTYKNLRKNQRFVYNFEIELTTQQFLL